MKTATYLRYSSDNQNETSLTDQLRMVEDRCKHEGWDKPIVFQDQAITGDRNDRPGYMAMLEAAENHQFDVLVVYALSRVCRDNIETLRFARMFEFWGVRVISVSDGYDNGRESHELEAGMHGIINQQYLRSLAKDVHRRCTSLALAGYSPGVYPYGYTSVKEGEGFKRMIDEEKAQWVRHIFSQYAQGVSPRQIVAELNRQGIKGPKGGKWSPSTIQSKKGKTGQIGMLGNPAYIGQHIWNRTKRKKNPLTEKKVVFQRPQEDWITTDIPELRIVDEDTWAKCQARIAKNTEVLKQRGSKNAGGRTAKYLFSGLLRCGVCGSPYVMKNGIYYGCSSSVFHNDKPCTNHRAVRRTTLEQTLLEGIKKELLSEEAYQMFEQETKELLVQEKADPTPIKKRIAEAEKELENLMIAIKAGILTATTKAEVESTEQKIKDGKNELKGLESYEPGKILPNAREMYRSLVLTLQNAENIHEIREAISGLVGMITLRPDQNSTKGLIAEFKNDIFASMLSGTNLLAPYSMRCLQRESKTISL